jgi:hypothetical protein
MTATNEDNGVYSVFAWDGRRMDEKNGSKRGFLDDEGL